MWMEHLAAVQKNRKRGAEKAALTPHQRSQRETQQPSSFCGLPYELTVTPEQESQLCSFCYIQDCIQEISILVYGRGQQALVQFCGKSHVVT